MFSTCHVRMWNAADVGCWRCRILWMWDNKDVGCMQCRILRM